MALHGEPLNPCRSLTPLTRSSKLLASLCCSGRIFITVIGYVLLNAWLQSADPRYCSCGRILTVSLCAGWLSRLTEVREPLTDLFSSRLCSRCRQQKKKKKLAGEFQIHIGNNPLPFSERLNIKIIQSGIQGMNCEGCFFVPAEMVSVSFFNQIALLLLAAAEAGRSCSTL